MTWEKLQEELFEQLFKTEEENIALKELLKQIEPVSKIWADLEKILIEDRSNEFDFFRSIKKIKINDDYIIIKIYSLNYIIINFREKKCLTDEEAKTLFDEEFFLTNFEEKKMNFDFVKMYDFESAGKQETVDNLIQYINENQEILTQKNYIYYAIDYLNSRISISINLSKKKSTIGMCEFNLEKTETIHVNYLFFNELAEITGASNPTNNKDSLLATGKRAPEIKIPISVIPKFIMDEDAPRLTYKSKE